MKRLEDEIQLSWQSRASTVDGTQGDGGRGGNRRSGMKLDQGSGGRGGNRNSIWETAVDENRKKGGRQGSKTPCRLQ